MKQKDQFSSQFAIGDSKKSGNGGPKSVTPGELLSKSPMTGQLSFVILNSKLDSKSMQGQVDGTILICLKLVMEDSLMMKNFHTFLFGVSSKLRYLLEPI
jgi:hypothetical protein